MSWKSIRTVASVSAMALSAVLAVPSAAYAQQCAGEQSGPSKTLNPTVAKVLQTVFELSQEERYQEAMTEINNLIANRGSGMAPFDKATTYEFRAGLRAQADDFRGAQQDFRVALETNELPPARQNQIRYYIAQIDFQLEDYQSAIRGLNAWIQNSRACGEAVSSDAYYLLAAAYIQLEPPNYRSALDPAERSVNEATSPRKGNYELLNLVYSELNETTKRIALLEKMIGLWPDSKSFWVQLSALYAGQQRDREAFTVLEVAYRAGLLDKETELTSLVQYYSYFENPYRGAKMLEREMAAGNIKKTQQNLVLLYQLWSQAREHKKAIPVIREAARNASDGELYYQLGMVLLADEQYTAAETALRSAINRGGMDAKDTGDAYLLLGTAIFSQAGPEDEEIWQKAREQFVNARRYEEARRRASDWITYIDAVINTYKDQKELARRQILERCKNDIERLERDIRIRDLQNRESTPAELAADQAIRDRCEPILNPPKAANAAGGAGGGDGDTENDGEE